LECSHLSSNSILNKIITTEEVLKRLRNVENNKSPGYVEINEYIASSLDFIIDTVKPVYVFTCI